MTSSSSSGNPGASFRDDPEYVRARRQIIRDNHPDRGGSDEALITALADLDEQWRRRTRHRPEIGDIRLPGFIPDDVARQATDLAEQYTDEVFRRAEEFQDRARRVVDAQTPKLRRLRKEAGRTAGAVVRSVQEHLPRRFPGARRYSSTSTGGTGTGPTRTTRTENS